MLHRTTVARPLGGANWGPLPGKLVAAPGAWLIQLALLFAATCLLACIYLWQSSAVADIERDTRRVENSIAQLEHKNVALMVQVARWNHPAYIEEQARKQGLVPAAAPLALEVLVAAPTSTVRSPVVHAASSIWRQFMDRLPRPAVAVAHAAEVR
ncbi:MAG: septum formation initiator family protein [Anaerolineae bacterium]|nr:septum formation initiator family protein [Anaerolineae bacterium]